MKITLIAASAASLLLIPTYGDCSVGKRPLATQALEYFRVHQTQDPFLRNAANEASIRLANFAHSSKYSGSISIYVTDFSGLPQALYSYRTSSCTATLDGLSPVVICYEPYMRQLEIAIRSFEEAGAFLQSDEKLLHFVRLVKNSSQDVVLKRLRADKRLAAVSDQSPSHIGDHLMLMIFFIASHEIGHIANDEGRAKFEQYILDENSTTPQEVRAAVLKMCEHSDDFEKAGFRLAGFGSESNGVSWSQEVQRMREIFMVKDKERYEETARQFAREEKADQFATQTILRYLSHLDSVSLDQALEQQHIIFESIFVLGIYTWYRDLISLDDVCGRLGNSSDLMSCTMQDPRRYIKASKLFGDAHRFVMLRSLLLMKAIIESRGKTFQRPKGQEEITHETLMHMPPKEALRTIWRQGDVQRYQLTSLLMDSPIKLAFAGCAAGWYLKKGNPKIVALQFDRLEDAMRRMIIQDESPKGSKDKVEMLESETVMTEANQAVEADLSEYPDSFGRILRLTHEKHPISGDVGGSLFRVNVDKGTVRFGDRDWRVLLTFSCEFGPESRDLVTEKQCVKDLLGEFVSYLESKGWVVKRTADDSQPGWIRYLMEVSHKNVRQFRFIFESEFNPAGTAAYSQVRIIK